MGCLWGSRAVLLVMVLFQLQWLAKGHHLSGMVFVPMGDLEVSAAEVCATQSLAVGLNSLGQGGGVCMSLPLPMVAEVC